MVAPVPLKAVGHAVPCRARQVTPGTASLISYPFFNHVGAFSLRVLGRKRLQGAFPLKGCQFVSRDCYVKEAQYEAQNTKGL
jgi:hypothetical protein